MTNNKKTLTAAFAALLLLGCGNEDSGTVSQNDRDLGVESQILKAVAGEQTDECSVQASWTGDIEGSVDWVPEKMPSATGFSISYKSFMIETGLFQLDAKFETPFEDGKTGTFEGKATYFYVTDTPYEGPQGRDGKVNIYFPMDGDRVSMGVPVTLEITQWQDAKISGSVSAGPFTGVAGGPQAPRDGGPNSPLKPITVNGAAQFQASGKITSPLYGRTECHKPYIR